MQSTQEEVIAATKRISELWRLAAWDELANCFAEGIVQVGPRLKELGRGRQAAIDSYRAFMAGAQLTEYHEENFRAEVWPGFATAVYEWRMKYITEGERRFSSGTDQFLFQKADGRLLAVWRFIDFWEDRSDQ
jgi:Domain of unknown function (DUF4440)